jgi:broad specificity phosphatase PhoE
MVVPGLLPGDETVGAMAQRVDSPIHQLLADFPAEGGIAISHGDPIQAFWIRHQRRPRWALHRLQCAKGGLLELDYTSSELRDITYVPPESHPLLTAERREPDEPVEPTASHA